MSRLRPEVRIRHARAYVVLNMLDDARRELALVPHQFWQQREAVEARLELHMAAKEWEFAARFGELLARSYPDGDTGWLHWAYALRELHRIREALDVLLEAEPRHGAKSATLHYNLACYRALLGDLPAARESLTRAFAMDPRLKAESLTDPDLAAIRDAARR